MQIALWSNDAYETGVTTISCVLSTLISAKYGYKTLLTHPMIRDTSLESYVLKPVERNQSLMVGESDADVLFRLLKNGKVSSDGIKDYCYSLLAQSNLDLLHTKKLYEDTPSHHMTYSYLLHLAKDFYDVIIVDLNVSSDSPLFESVIKDSDMILCIGSQNKRCIQASIEEMKMKVGTINESAYQKLLINRYDNDSNIRFRKLIGEHANQCIPIPYKKEIMDGCNRSELIDVLLKHFYYSKKSPLFDFYKPLIKMTAKMLAIQDEDVS